MAIAFNERTIPTEPSGPGVTRRNLLTTDALKATNLLLDRITLSAGASIGIETSGRSVAWLQMLDGEATLKAVNSEPMATHSVFVPPNFRVAISSAKGASVLCAEIPDAGKFDADFSPDTPYFMAVDWTREAVYECDTRKRIFLVGPNACGTKAMLAAMVIYPAGATSSKFRHEGAAAFSYILEGHGTASANDKAFAVAPGDFIHFPDREWHSLQATEGKTLRFLTFHVPGIFKTVWADPTTASRWVETNRNINGGPTALDWAARRI
jgi:quercetin dioxygenase-like cupin family protein